jgi:AcrR family transcriptional regulator
MTRPQRRSQLLDVGRALFAERGVDGTSVEEVAARAGVSKPIVYDHFGGKDGLFAAVVDREVADLLARFAAALEGDDPRRLLEQATLALLGYVEQAPDGFRVLVRPSAGPDGDPPSASVLSAVAARVEHLLSDRLGSSAAWAGLYAQALVGQGSLVGQWWLDHPGPAREDVAARLVDLAWHGLSGLQRDPVLVSLEVPGPRPVSRPLGEGPVPRP